MSIVNPTVRRKAGHWMLLAVILLAGSSPSFGAEVGDRPEKSEVTVAYPQPSGSMTLLWVADDSGLFRKHGINTKLQLLSPQATVQAILSGSVDVAMSADLMTARLEGAPVKLFASSLLRYVFHIYGAKGITDIQQLKGKTVAVSIARAPIDNSTREVLKKNGLIPDQDVKFLYAQTVPAILTAIVTGNVAAGTLSPPATLKARESGLSLLADIGKLNIPGILSPFGASEKYMKENPNTIYAFVKAVSEALVLCRKDPAAVKKAIGRYTKTDDLKVIDETYEAFAPYWPASVAVPAQVIQVEFGYLDEKRFPQARTADPREFFDNSFVNNLESSGFFKTIGLVK